MKQVDEVKTAIQALRKGQMIILADDEDRENEGDLVMAAEHVTPEAINFMITHARGLVCLTITPHLAQRLELAPMVTENSDPHATNFTESIDGAPWEGVGTGISAYDRARTIRLALEADPSKLRKPGHVFPLVARPGGLAERRGHTEASIELMRLAELYPAAVIVEILNPDGSMARDADLRAFASKHDLVYTTVEKLAHFIDEENHVAAF